MSNFKKIIIAAFLAILSLGAEASLRDKVKIDNLALEQNRPGFGQMIVSLEGQLLDSPELLVNDKMIQISVPNSYVWPKIEKKVTLQESHDTTVMAYQFEKDVVRVRAMLPYSLKGKEGLVSVVMRDGFVELNFPHEPRVQKAVAAPIVKATSTPRVEARTVKAEVKNENAKLDEAFLNNLVASSDFDFGPESKEVAPVVEDKVVLSQAAPERTPTAFSMTGYIGKFVAFLGLVLLLFYAVVALMKKGVIKKGSLGFLNSTKVVEVLSTTYIAPKKSLIMVKAHNQVFLVGSCEKGLNLISEVTDVTGLIKSGEKEVAGNNFDTSLKSAGKVEKAFKLKEELPEIDTNDSVATGLQNLLDEKPVKDTVKLSDQIKNKVKNLKSLQ